MLAAVALLLAVAGDKPLNLNGHWRTDRGEEVVIAQEGSKITATFVAGADCPFGGTRSFFIDGELDEDALSGEMMVCTRVEKLVTDCGLDPVYAVDFRAQVTSREISGRYKPDYVNYDQKGGKYVNCRVKHAGGSPNDFKLTRIGCAADEVAKAKALLDSYTKTRDLYAKAKANLKPKETFAQVQDWVAKQLASETHQPVTVSGETGGDISYTNQAGRPADPDEVPDPGPGQTDPRRDWDVHIPIEKAEATGYEIVDQVTAQHEQGHADAMAGKFKQFKDGTIDWKAWDTYSTFSGGPTEIAGYIDEEIARYDAGIKTLRDFIASCRGAASPK